MRLTKRAAGVLLHATSLPGPYGVGDLGPEAARFVDWLAAAGQRWWQTLPVGPAGEGHSPYRSPSAFAGNPLLLSLERLVEAGLLRRREIGPPRGLGGERARYEEAAAFKGPLLRKAFERFRRRAPRSFDAFRSRRWVAEFAAFHAPDSAFHEFLQFEFDRQWRALRAHARRRGVALLGDVPLYVAPDGADVAAYPEIFKRGVVAGVPPDYFSATGQLWGNPVYRWDVLRRRGYDWWIDRLRVDFERFDALRLDHFIGFVRVWEVEAGARTAERGRFAPGPGADFFRRVLPALGRGRGRALIAEDLGLVTPEVRELRRRLRFPGMRVLQFDPEGPGERRQVVYTGTHDNDTTAGWLRRLGAARRRELGAEGPEGHWRMIERALASRADLAIVPAQDLLGLGSGARMNRPGRPRGNWRWRLESGKLDAGLARRLRLLTRRCRR
jgi:4-alpha-glucanotransferase